MKKYKIYGFMSLLAFAVACSGGAETSTEEQVAENNSHAHHDHAAHSAASNAKSPRTAAMANIGKNHVHIDYSAPSVRGREIYGGLVAWDEVWVTGAHTATSISFDVPVSIEGKKIPAGKYALFTIPGQSGWTVILNSNYEQHLADEYDESEDIARFTLDNEMPENSVEQLRFEVVSLSDTKGEIRFAWAERGFRLAVENS
ncbi:hypothetical protein A3SI_10799 [Nitritalea halalkaliphila LW7]|uniref:DUF2911 domain-containing protein n=1 Tax=Nitritalea halalkaliphila LW7 TaxID=1189621 RepID=I5C392_9BACT|nr:DUF2911 domain-containing protein [Nitritalea halalkaliphila]EIM76294.1 hypothetical protein A3SI_10799 [Nitritalea halalkaliphila LW7]